MRLSVPGAGLRWKVPVVVATHFVCAMAYLALLHLSPEPKLLEWSAVDRAVPFWPPAVLAYLAHFAAIWIFPLLLRDAENLNRCCAAMVLATLLACVCFAAFPVRTPLQDLSLVQSWLRPAFRLILFVDAPHGNCLPSLHVVLSWVTAAAYARERGGGWVYAWSGVVAVAVLLIKQHYFVDVVAGLALAWASLRLVETRLRFAIA